MLETSSIGKLSKSILPIRLTIVLWVQFIRQFYNKELLMKCIKFSVFLLYFYNPLFGVEFKLTILANENNLMSILQNDQNEMSIMRIA